ncbi:hypothetical protein ANN_21376 [Periplaneta americana]|uniref:DUF4817 domain-containing protein n=1 Tax=Periplaneta americana TaxID=6978 RepID=A0ABQ8SFG7_PERAM|nr:hypothetical protein ANN_21376 [Periplaneta americana]
MSTGSNTESYPAFAHIGLRENPGKHLNQRFIPEDGKSEKCACFDISGLGRSRVATYPENVQATVVDCGVDSCCGLLHVKTANTQHTTCTDVSHLYILYVIKVPRRQWKARKHVHLFINNMQLSFYELKWILKCYWKVENVFEVQRRWRVEFGTQPPTRLTITRIRDKFEVDGTVQDMLKGRCGRKRSSTDNESVDAVMQTFAQSPKKSMRQCSHEIGISKSSVHRILRAQKWKTYIPRLVHALNEDLVRRLKLCEWFWNMCDEREEIQDLIVWSDEPKFKHNGTINRHNCGYWVNENSHLSRKDRQYSRSNSMM